MKFLATMSTLCFLKHIAAVRVFAPDNSFVEKWDWHRTGRAAKGIYYL